MGYSLGVDLGTTYTAAAVSQGRYAEIVPLGDRAPQAPSVVYRSPSATFVFGDSAERHAFSEPERVAREFKRRMGDATQIIIAGTPMSAHALSRALLGWVVATTSTGHGGPPERLTVTFPANWGPYRRELMSQVVALNADFPIDLCTEPEAAAVHFAAAGRVQPGQTIAVYDLGGGTFDASILQRGADGDFALLGTPDGVEHLGGVDFDDAVFGRVVGQLPLTELDPEDPDVVAALGRLRRDCSEAKEALSTETEVIIPVLLGPVRTRVRLTRSELEELITPLIADTIESLDRAVRRAGLAARDLDAIVLAGGSARLPLVSELVTQHLGRTVAVSSQPKLCVAMGAALLGAGRLSSAPTEAPVALLPAPARPAPTGPAGWTGAIGPARLTGMIESTEPAELTASTGPAGLPGATGPARFTALTGPDAARVPVSAPTPSPLARPAGSASPALVPSAPVPLAPTSGGPGPHPAAGGPAESPAARVEEIGLPADRPAPSGPVPESPVPESPVLDSRRASPRLPAAQGRAHRSLRWYGIAACLFGLLALLIMFVLPAVPPTGPAWTGELRTTADPAAVDGATLVPTVLGISLGTPVPADNGSFDLGAYQVLLAGPMRAELIGADGRAEQRVIHAEQRWSWQRLANVPAVAMVLAALFSFAYAESIARGIRRHRRRATSGELLGLIGSGAVAGLAAVLITWVLGDRLLPVGSALAVVASVCAAVGLLGFTWQSSAPSWSRGPGRTAD